MYLWIELVFGVLILISLVAVIFEACRVVLETRLGLEGIWWRKCRDAGEQWVKDMGLRLHDIAGLEEGLRHLIGSYFVAVVDWDLSS